MFLLRFECKCTTCGFEHYVICSAKKVTTSPPPPPPATRKVRRCPYAYDSCDYPKRPIRQQRHSRPDRIAFYLYDRDDANDKLYDEWKLPETTHMTKTTMWKPGLTCHWRRRNFPFRKRSMPFSRHFEIFLTVNEFFATKLKKKENLQVIT